MQLCTPLNADFDGDTVSIQGVPEEVAEDVYNKMSARYMHTFKKNNQPIFQFNHETLNGLAIASEYTPEDPNELKEPRYFYTDYVQLLKDVEVERKIKIGTPIVFTGEVGGVKYQSKVTSYGRIRISKILEADLENIHVLKTPTSRIDAKAATKLSGYLNGFPENGLEKRRDLQVFALRVVTLAGVTTFDYKTLYVDTKNDTYRRICKIADSPDLTDQQKLALLTSEYKKYEKEVEDMYTDELKDELNRAARVKLSSISSLNTPQLIISGIDEKPIITRGNLLSGYTEPDMQIHSIENRALLSIKTSGVF